MHRAASVEPGYFSPAPGRRLDKDAVCARAALAARAVACVHKPGTLREGGRSGRAARGGGYIYTLVTPVRPGKHGDIPGPFSWLDAESANKTAARSRGFLFPVLLYEL